MILGKYSDKSGLRYRNMNILLADVVYYYCVPNRFIFDETKVHMDKTVLQPQNGDLCLLLKDIVTLCFVGQVTYIERLRPTL